MPKTRAKLLEEINAGASKLSRIQHVDTTPFGPRLKVDRYRMGNGLEILHCEDRSAPVVAFHTWYRVGSRHEVTGKTGLAHLFEHLMFNETENLGAGEFDRKLEEAGAESNAGTWLDWTNYHVAIPKSQLKLVVRLEAERMTRLVVRDPQVASEKEVVANERRYRVDDDVESAVSELLWATAFTTHAYHWPTIGWMEDIEAFSTSDCVEFYKTYYAPNNASLVVAGDATASTLLRLVQSAYGSLEPSALPAEDVHPEPPQTEERRREVEKPTATQKLCVGYKSPALGDEGHVALSVLVEVLFGGRASRVYQKLVRDLELASEVRAFVGPFRDPSLTEVFCVARGSHSAEELLAALDAEIARVREEPIADEEIERARARFELSLLAGLETADGKASTIGFFDTVLGRPNAAFERLETVRRIDASDLRRAARRYLTDFARTIVFVRPSARESEEAAQ